jgi:hypothetical protein
VEEINEESVGKVIESLIKSKPFLVGSTSASVSDGNFARTNKEAAPIDGVAVLQKFIGGYTK